MFKMDDSKSSGTDSSGSDDDEQYYSEHVIDARWLEDHHEQLVNVWSGMEELMRDYYISFRKRCIFFDFATFLERQCDFYNRYPRHTTVDVYEVLSRRFAIFRDNVDQNSFFGWFEKYT